MVLHYYYGGKHYTIIANWTDSDGKSAVFSDIIGKLQANYGPVFEKYRSTATELDAAVDKLYKHIYIFGDEHNALPYNPKFRKRFTEAYSAVCDILASCLDAGRSEAEGVLQALYMQILDKLQELVGVYLLDNAYQGKYRYRRKNFEEWAETIDEKRMQHEFESVVLQMNDISTLMDCLTETQRQRLVKHLFMKYTMQEIADQEYVAKQSVEESIAAALRKIKSMLTGG